jgi:CRISPR system Cascade subunit CasE
MSESTSVFLSRLVLNPGNRDVQRGIENCHAFHQTIMRGFPTVATDAPRKEFYVLYRPELDAHSGALTVLVQSLTEPNWAPLRGDWSAVLTAESREPLVKRVDSAFQRIAAGSQLRFRLRANPTKRLIKTLPDGSPNKGGGKRVQLFHEADQLAWLMRKGETGGFRVESVQARADRLGGKRQVGRRGQRDIVLDAVVFDGELTVIDAAVFQRTLVAGIGSGKAYGFGLLSVAPNP